MFTTGGNLDDTAPFCMSNSHFSPIKVSLCDIWGYWEGIKMSFLLLHLMVWNFDIQKVQTLQAETIWLFAF